MNDFDDQLPQLPIKNINDVRYDRYSKLKLLCVYQLGDIYHCETECDNHLWIEAHIGKLVMCLAETYYEMGANAEPIAKYFGAKPDFKQIKEHMKWEINEEDIWVN